MSCKQGKHILVVTQYYKPEPFRIDDICVELVKRGYRVTVLTGIPNYPEGKFYTGYGLRKKRRETIDGVDVVRIPIFARGKSFVGLALNYLSFVVSGFFWNLFTSLKADAVFTFGLSPIFQALPAIWYSKKRKIPHYLYVQDLWPESFEMVTGIHSPIIVKPLSKMVTYIYDKSDKILGTSPSFVEEIRKRAPKGKENIFYFPQYAEPFYVPREKGTVSEIPDDGRFKVIFAGNVGIAQGLDILPPVAARLRDKGVRNVRFVIVGDGRYREQLLEDIAKYEVEDMFTMVERQPSYRIPELFAACDVAFISLKGELLEKTIPAKLQSYMACGMPVLGAMGGEAAKVIQEARCGVCCPADDVDELSSSIVTMMENGNLREYSDNAISYNDQFFNKDKLMDILEKEIIN